jgi:hypothetical protein
VFHLYHTLKGVATMKKKLLVLTLALAGLGVPCFGGAVHLTGSLAADFLTTPSAEQIINTFAVGSQPLLCGVGWEVVLNRIGFGGDYLVNFFRHPGSDWWLDWYGQAFYLSYHLFGAHALVDPFLQVGLGCAGRVHLADWTGPATENLLLSLFPFVSAGVAFNLDGLLLAGKVSWTPFVMPPPVTDFANYPLGKLQVTLSAGLSLGW